MKIKPLDHCFGIEITDCNLQQPLSMDERKLLLEHLLTHQLIVFKHQDLSVQQLNKALDSIGKPIAYPDPEFTHPQAPEISVVSNIINNGMPLGYDMSETDWHIDGTYFKEPPQASLLYAKIAAKHSGATRFASTLDACQRLPQKLLAELSAYSALHDIQNGLDLDDPSNQASEINFSQFKTIHPLIKTHPLTKQSVLYVNLMAINRILELDDAKSASLIRELLDFATEKSVVYTHQWQDGDLVLMDNYSLIHTATPTNPDDPRLVYRVMLRVVGGHP